MSSNIWQNKRVWLTGHTGFKGSWLSLWLKSKQATLYGFSLAPNTSPNIFTLAAVEQAFAAHTVGDINDLSAVRQAMHAAQPEVIFHLAAQPLVRPSYHDPVYTFATNIMGTVNVLEAARHCPTVKAIVVITTDKCYENPESALPFTEAAPLGGHDPYSASKAGTEIVTSSYYRSFFKAAGVGVATARAGNVIGGGDWAADRIVPDLIRAYASQTPLNIRYPQATRPWQHVLEPVAGYTLLAERLLADQNLSGPWNFGPALQDCVPVAELIKLLQEHLPVPVDMAPGPHHHEANFLQLDTTKSRAQLNWQPRLNLQECVALTAAWYQAALRGDDMAPLTMQQITDYQGSAGSSALIDAHTKEVKYASQTH